MLVANFIPDSMNLMLSFPYYRRNISKIPVRNERKQCNNEKNQRSMEDTRCAETGILARCNAICD